jgi:cargo-transport protein YPP1
VAQTERAVVKAAKDHPSSPVNLDSSGLISLVAPLFEGTENEQTFGEDKFQGQVCLGWIYWIAGEASVAAVKLPARIPDLVQPDGAKNQPTGWTRVCALKASYIKGTALARTGAVAEAIEAFQSVLTALSTAPSKPGIVSPEERAWAELLLTQFCMLCGHATKKLSAPLLETEALPAFRAWTSFWDQQVPPPGGIAPQSNIPRRQVWKEYYITLSSILQKDLPYQTTSTATAATFADTSARLLQRAELQQVETRYEALLMQEVQFPRADQASGEVEEWADLVVQNWRILCGSSWQEQELGEGGREAVSRGVLDILYRAATKTFHSTSILRHLFTLHMAVAEFDLAFKAFDTYLDAVKKGKARVGKTGEAEKGLDDDETVIKTASECIVALCRYGSREAAEKAKDLGQFFEGWLEKHYQQQPSKSNVNGGQATENEAAPSALLISPQGLAMAWRSIGIAQAQWARFTNDAGSRADIQSEAVKSLHRALLPKYEQTDNVNTLFALAMVLAECRELSAAIDVVKTALLPPKKLPLSKSNYHQASYSRFSRERSLIPLWHLLALLLSARQEFTTAVRSCEGAFEQFKDPKTLFGDAKLHGGYRSEHLNRIGLQSTSEKFHASKGVVDEMDDFEKVAVLEVKMTQLALIEVLEGPDVAVNSSDELLSLYTRLFGEPQQPATAAPKTAQISPPKSSAGTLRSLKGSFFGRSMPPTRKLSGTRGRTSSYSEKTLSARPHTSNTSTSVTTGAPTIHVTNENGGSPDQTHREKLQKRTPSLARNKSLGSLRNRSPITEQNLQRTLSATTGKSRLDGDVRLQKKVATTLNDSEQNERQRDNIRGNPTVSQGPSPSQGGRQNLSSKPLPPISQNTSQSLQSSKASPSASRLPDKPTQPLSINPVTRFPKDQERRYRIGVLVKVWLLIAGFYRRAEMYEDAKGAIDEAYKLVGSLEMDVSRDVSGVVSIDNSSWGIFKSVEEQWGDVWTEVSPEPNVYVYQPTILQRGHLSNAKSSPYIALSDFEAALVHSSDHPSAIVGLSNILLDIYTEMLPPPPMVPSTILQDPFSSPSQSTLIDLTASAVNSAAESTISSLPQPRPLGLPTIKSTLPLSDLTVHKSSTSNLRPSQKVSTTALLDRLAARDRAIGLLLGLTKLGTGWDYSDAWYALARAYEEVGQIDKAKEVLWWCVELEEARAVREWSCVGAGGYVL